MCIRVTVRQSSNLPSPHARTGHASGVTVGVLQQGSIQLLSRSSERYALYSVDGGVLEAAGFTAAELGDGSDVAENQTVTGVRWQGGLPGGTIEAFSAAVPELAFLYSWRPKPHPATPELAYGAILALSVS